MTRFVLDIPYRPGPGADEQEDCESLRVNPAGRSDCFDEELPVPAKSTLLTKSLDFSATGDSMGLGYISRRCSSALRRINEGDKLMLADSTDG